MEQKKKKGLMIAIIVTIIIIVIAGLGFVYLATDLFKSNEQLFYKYVEKNAEIAKIFQSKSMEESSKWKEENVYTTTGEVSLSSDEEEVQKALDSIKVTVDAKTDNKNKNAISNIAIKYQNNDFFKVSYVRNQDKYALRSDEIATGYIGIENKDLKKFMQKLGVMDTTTIPDKLEATDWKEIFTLTEQESKNIQEIYSKVLSDSIEKEKYTKASKVKANVNGVEYISNKYTLSLTEKELAVLQKNILTALSQDSITLNLIVTKAKMIGMNENDISVNKLNESIQEAIQEIDETTYSDNEKIKISVYAAKGELVKTEILLVDNSQMNISVFGTEEDITAVIDMIPLGEGESQTVNMKVQKTTTENTTKLQMQATTIGEEESTTLSMTMNNNKTANGVQESLDFTVISDESSVSLTYKQESKLADTIDGIPTLDTTNSAILNDYSAEQISQFLAAVIMRTQVVFSQKMQTIGTGTTQPNNIIETQKLENFNSKFENFEGNNIPGTNVRSLVDIVATSNAASDGKLVSINLGGNLIQDVQNQKEALKLNIDTGKNYNISFSYDTQGYITAINIQ